MKQSDIIGFIGVAILLVAFLLNLAKVLHAKSRWYIGMNAFGACLTCASSAMINYVPFIILEGVWALVSFVAFALTFRKEES